MQFDSFVLEPLKLPLASNSSSQQPRRLPLSCYSIRGPWGRGGRRAMHRVSFRWRRNLVIGGGSGIGRLQHRPQHFTTQPAARLAGKVALITGAASGIGKATAAEFINHGATVILADIQHERGKAAAAELGAGATFIPCDVTQESDIAAAVDLAVAKHGRLDIMHNNAGISGTLTFAVADLDLAGFDRTMAVNARSVVAGIKHAARVMVPRCSGCIICTASIAGLMAGVAPLDYSVSKAAVLGAVRSAAAELGRHGIRVNCISPHALPTPFGIEALSRLMPEVEARRATEMIEATGELAGTVCEAEDMARAAVFLASDEAKYISGHNLVVDGGFITCKQLAMPHHPDD